MGADAPPTPSPHAAPPALPLAAGNSDEGEEGEEEDDDDFLATEMAMDPSLWVASVDAVVAGALAMATSRKAAAVAAASADADDDAVGGGGGGRAGTSSE